MSHQDANLILFCCLNEAVRLGDTLSNGLLDKKMKALLGAGDADRRMEMVWNGKDDTLELSFSIISS